MGLHLGGIGTRIAIFDQDVAAGRPSELPEPLPEILKITLRVWIILGDPQQYRDPPHSDHRHRRLLRPRRERTRDRRATEKRDDLAYRAPFILVAWVLVYGWASEDRLLAQATFHLQCRLHPGLCHLQQ